MKTNIEWTDRSSNPLRYRDKDGNDVWACVKKSTGCASCYAEAMALRFGKGKAFTAANMRELTPYVREKELKELLSPKKTPAGSKVFVCDMTDLFGDWVPFELVDTIFAAFALRPDVVFQVLTKRPERMAAYMSQERGDSDMMPYGVLHELFKSYKVSAMGAQWPLPNVWIGTSVENQQAADERIPHLLKVPATVRFLSCEPLLGPVDLSRWLRGWECPVCGDDDEDGKFPLPLGKKYCGCCAEDTGRDVILDMKKPGVHWVITGGESGTGHRDCDPVWQADIVRQCEAAGVPVFVKQDSAHKSGQQGRIPLAVWDHKQFPEVAT